MASTSTTHERVQLPPAPHRPELGGNRYQGPFRTNEEYISRVQSSESIFGHLLALEECTENGIELVRNMEEQLYNLELFCPPSVSGIVQLEHSLLETGAFPSLLQGLFYMLPIFHNGKLFVRYLETGAYRGFLEKMLPYLKRHYRILDSNLLPWKVYTEKDVLLEGARWSGSEEGRGYKSSTKYQRKVGSDNPKQCNKTCIMSQINVLERKLDECGAVVFIQKARASATCSSHRFLYCSGLWEEHKATIDEELGKYVSHSTGAPDCNTLLSHIENFPRQSMKDQFLLLSSISNYHWFAHSTQRPRLNYVEHILFDPTAKLTAEGNFIRTYVPRSPRNKLMYYLSISDGEEKVDSGQHLYRLVKEYLNADNPDRSISEFDDVAQPVRKKRKTATRLLSVSRSRFCESVGADLNTILNCANPNRTLYRKFQEEMITEGLLKWRYNMEDRDICVMTDINPSSGSLVPNAYVHVSCWKNGNGEILLKCSCAIYNLIKRAAHQDVELWPSGVLNESEEEGVLDQEFTCMHCRFFRDYLIGAYRQVLTEHGALSRVMMKVKESLEDMQNPIQVLGGVFPTSATKFSVQGGDTFSVVHLNFVQGKCYAKCMEGMCCVKLQNKKKVCKSIPLKEKGRLCLHLQTLFDNLHYVESLFPEYFQVSGDVIEESGNIVQAPIEEVNNEDGNVDAYIQGNFNLDTGLWEYKSLSKHIPKEMMQPQLITATQKRNDFINSHTFDPDTGLYGLYRLIPSPIDPTGRPKVCQCGAGYPVNPAGDLKGTANLYTRMGVLKCCYFNIQCSAGQCELSYETAAEEEGIFFYSKQTCAGDEVGWDFINRVMRSKISFTAFCADMTRMYTTNQVSAAPFMSYVTFVKWFFGWLAAFKIDFRKEVDPWCKHNPKILACDGTHIGVSLRNMQLEKPVTRPDEDTTVTALHRRYDRVLLQDRMAHKHLRYLTEKHLGKLRAGKELTNEEEGARTITMLNKVTQNCHRPVAQFILDYAQKTQDDQVIDAMGRLLYMLSGDACMSSVAPFPSHDMIRYICLHIGDQNRIQQPLEDLRRYNVEMSNLLKLSIQHGCEQMVTAFLDYLVEKIQDVHANDRPTAPANPIPNSYNPRSGTAYYFTESGEQLRQMPDYKVSGTRNKNYDDPPLVEDGCRKLFPEVSFGGFGYIFLWFCPIHGHCYGMHLIAGGEGRKDPFSSIFKYAEKAPEHIFYDFACQLSEYCLNREPEFFKNTRFWHDLFHSVGHLCGLNFKSGRVEGLEGINSEICEQVNAFLQCIKYTASHLSQDHFMFFLQFFLHLMNKEKTQKFRKLASIAVAGQL